VLPAPEPERLMVPFFVRILVDDLLVAGSKVESFSSSSSSSLAEEVGSAEFDDDGSMSESFTLSRFISLNAAAGSS